MGKANQREQDEAADVGFVAAADVMRSLAARRLGSGSPISTKELAELTQIIAEAQRIRHSATEARRTRRLERLAT